jgi:hypothetical protein
LQAPAFFVCANTVPFKQHNDPKGSNFMVEARGYSPSERGGLTKDVIFIKK